MADARAPVGVLLANLGTPDEPTVPAVRRYLREFLTDPRVIDTNAFARNLLVYGAVLPFRPRTSAAAYAKVWTEQGSPLLHHSRALAAGVQEALGSGFQVELAMRYGRPAIAPALASLAQAGAERVIVLPLFPQYASSSTGSALERIYGCAGAHWNVAALRVIAPFYADGGFIRSLAAVARPELERFGADYLLMSYHGLPERQIRKSDASRGHCLASEGCCGAIGAANRFCYRAQCFETSRRLALELGLESEGYGVSFQSRLGRTPWIRPFTDLVLPELAGRGVRRLAVLCPSFVADCLETLEEIGIRAAEQWTELGGEALRLVPCVNAHPAWVETVAGWVRGEAGA